jgi:hypothetical protein
MPKAKEVVGSPRLRRPNAELNPRTLRNPMMAGYPYRLMNRSYQVTPPTIRVHFIRESRRNPDFWDSFLARDAVPTNLSSMPISLRSIIWQYHGDIGPRNRWRVVSVVVKQADGWPDMNLIGLNGLMRDWIFCRMEQNGWRDYVEIRYKEN